MAYQYGVRGTMSQIKGLTSNVNPIDKARWLEAMLPYEQYLDQKRAAEEAEKRRFRYQYGI